MQKTTILVLSEPGEPQLSMLRELPQSASSIIGNSLKEFENAAATAEVLFNWSGSLELIRSVFLKCPKLRWVHSRSVGLERMLFPELIASDVILTNGKGVFSASLGEFTLGAILYFAKDLRRMIRNQAAQRWEPFDVEMISGQTVGIVGYGDIGRAVAERVRPMGMNVLAVKRHVSASDKSDPLVDKVFERNKLADMISQSDYIVVATPLNEETRGLIGPAEFAVMKKTAVLINLGRGPVIEEATMIKALSNGSIRGAALDVFDEEPLPAGHPFYKMENVLLSPHCADHTSSWLDDAMRFFLDQFARYSRGEPLRNVVDKKLGY
jgi:phosphoglycerate dehydrogenase-like enzyme